MFCGFSSRGGRGGAGRGMGPPSGPRRPAYDPYPAMDRYDRYDRYEDYYRYDRARPYPDPYERERRQLPAERPLPPLYDRRPLPGARLTPPSDPYRRPPPEYYDRRYEWKHTLLFQSDLMMIIHVQWSAAAGLAGMKIFLSVLLSLVFFPFVNPAVTWSTSDILQST